jgi:hypothetical protein
MRLLSLVLLLIFSNPAFADEKTTMFYGGFGQADEQTSTSVDDNPFSLGVLFFPVGTDNNWGFDIAGEGEMLDSTWGGNNLRQSLSYNFLIGTNLSRDDNMRIDVSAIIGIRKTFSDCPSSYIGYQCYANTAPNTDYGFNGGVLLMTSWETYSLGIRATSESVQGVLGLRF